jgi:hypothetical protein
MATVSFIKLNYFFNWNHVFNPSFMFASQFGTTTRTNSITGITTAVAVTPHSDVQLRRFTNRRRPHVLYSKPQTSRGFRSQPPRLKLSACLSVCLHLTQRLSYHPHPTLPHPTPCSSPRLRTALPRATLPAIQCHVMHWNGCETWSLTLREVVMWVWNGVHSASWVQLRSYLIEK